MVRGAPGAPRRQSRHAEAEAEAEPAAAGSRPPLRARGERPR